MHVVRTRGLERGDPEPTATVEGTEGERWTREALDRLRARSFSPPGLLEFLAASFARARHVRARRPELVAQSRRFGAAGLVASAALGPGAMVRWVAWWAMLDWHLGMVETTGSERRARALEAADIVTLARLWAAPLARRSPHPAVIAAASATDVVDGLLARQTGPTRLGRDLDSAADAAFFHAAVRGLVERGSLSRWVLAAERAQLVAGISLGSASYLGASARPATLAQRALPASLGTAGLLLAASAGRRVRGGTHADRGGARGTAHALVTAAIVARTLRALSAVRRRSGREHVRRVG